MIHYMILDMIMALQIMELVKLGPNAHPDKDPQQAY